MQQIIDEMKRTAREQINDYIYRMFLNFMESREAGEMAYALTDKVIDDMVETADADNWNTSDINLALSRIMISTFCEK